MSVSAAGHLVVARVGGLDIIDIMTGAAIKSIHFEERKFGFTVEPYKDLLIVGVSTGSEERRTSAEVVIYNLEYEEIGRWRIPSGSCDLAVVDNRVFLAGADPFSGNIKVFSLNGQQQPDIIWNGKTVCITSIPPCSISFGDRVSKKIYKQQITDGKKGITWSAPAPIPRCMCIDQSGLIWVRSNRNDSITYLSRHGWSTVITLF